MNKTISAADLGIDLKEGGEGALFKWFIASFLMGKRIQADIAAQAYRVIIEQHDRDTPLKLGHCSHRELVAMLGQAHYVRYDETTADRLSALCKKLNDEYAGKIGNIQGASDNRMEFEKRMAEFEGVGPKTVEIFMRDAGEVLY
ncbi:MULTISPECIES: DNA methylase [unclassified Pseudomonas]|uniref:DNA methylase n=1 Tax=unclassified Pseudomonas TaxID=196821 RepID=UPI002AC94C1D|nr:MULTISPECIES: DNA methylase [unclassified Pseudomonas]MEB0041034.1 DNA methylase [Pseudomonas sp. MH10]MEB0076627.1 DNA methylase [Pseudomonas sp. MH10out]MEB0100715.1 DNA methylase [Pseudomonas sp. CCI3.2]MEB0130330.1 DNA methylase [Pseudomonas sp. CCI2.4]MEB0158858.1 DNA methylase [Pseudomonas sp. AH2 (2023)]